MGPAQRVQSSSKPSRLHWSLFARTFTLYLLITAASVGIVGLLAVGVSNDRILDEVSVASSYALDSKRSVIEERLQKVESIALQTMYNASTFRLVWSEHYGPTGLLIMRDLMEMFRSIVLAQDWLHSIYFFTSRTGYVLSTTKYNKTEFPDQEVLALPATEGTTALGPRQVGNDMVMTFVRTFSFFGNNTTGTVVMNVFYDRFFQKLLTGAEGPGLAVISTGGELVFPGTLPEHFPSVRELTASSEPIETLSGTGSARYLVVRDRSVHRPWIYVYFREYGEVVRSASLVRRIIFVSLGAVLLAAVLGVWAITRRLQRPLVALARWSRTLGGQAGSGDGDEYGQVRRALGSLVTENRDLTERYNAVFSYFRRHSITELLHTRNWDVARFDSIVQLLGLRLTRSRFHTAIFELRGADDRVEDLSRSLDTLMNQSEVPVTAVAAEEDTQRVALIINTDAEASKVLTLMERIQKGLEDRGMSTVISLSQPFGDLADLPDRFSETEEQIEHQAFFGAENVVYDSGGSPRVVSRSRIAGETDAVLAAVRSHDPNGFRDALERFAQAAAAAGVRSIGDARFTYFSLADRLEQLLPGSDVDGRQTAFCKAQEAQSSQELKAMVAELGCSIMDRLVALRRDQHGDTVRRAVAWIEGHLGENISVDNIAEAVFLSSRYLNTLFRSELNQTVFEYLSSLRIKRAESLLAGPKKLRIREIARAVGYFNPQSFVRLFKRHLGMTPAEYRRSRTTPQSQQSPGG